MQTPASTVPLELTPFDNESTKTRMEPGDSSQKIVRFDLTEEGNHILAVSLSYSETVLSKEEKSASSGRVRSFRKLYQFIAQPCLSVRTKVSDFPLVQVSDGKGQMRKFHRYALEAQLENLADDVVTLENVSFDSKPPFNSTSVNWDATRRDQEQINAPMLAPRDIWQVAFLIEQQQDETGDSARKELSKDGRTVLGQLSIQWRGAMGDSGNLSTGWLMTRRR
ncbi:hypothetical protein MMC12_002097 [Toensbergia leucococca]|nr:hypothetical protein [Toensbergia leucococca]